MLLLKETYKCAVPAAGRANREASRESEASFSNWQSLLTLALVVMAITLFPASELTLSAFSWLARRLGLFLNAERLTASSILYAPSEPATPRQFSARAAWLPILAQPTRVPPSPSAAKPPRGPHRKTLVPGLTAALGVAYTPFMFYNKKGKLVRTLVFNPFGTPCFGTFLEKVTQVYNPELTSSRGVTVAYRDSSGRFMRIMSSTELDAAILDSQLRRASAVALHIFMLPEA